MYIVEIILGIITIGLMYGVFAVVYRCLTVKKGDTWEYIEKTRDPFKMFREVEVLTVLDVKKGYVYYNRVSYHVNNDGDKIHYFSYENSEHVIPFFIINILRCKKNK